MKEKVFSLFGDWLLKVQWAPRWLDISVGLAIEPDYREFIFTIVVCGIGFQVSNVA
ncbi:MAG: hypothetical protein AB7R40_23150 [Nitrospiraceae bacterium]